MLTISFLVMISASSIAMGAESQLYIDDGTKLVWKALTEELDGANGNVLSNSTAFWLMNATDTAAGPDYINCSYDLFTNNTEYLEENIEEESAWDYEIFGSMDKNNITDSETYSKYKTFFNEQNFDLQTGLDELAEEEKYGLGLALNLLLSPEVLGVMFALAFAPLSPGFEMGANSSSITSLGSRNLNTEAELAFGVLDGGNWDNLSLDLTSTFIYTASSNVLSSYSSTVHLKSAEWNISTSSYDIEESWTRHSVTIQYPSDLISDLDVSTIPGYDIAVFMTSLLIALGIIQKRKIQNK